MKKFKYLGVMIDMSRNAVMSVDGLKAFLPLLKKMGYNCVMLYTEDTYEIDGEAFFGYMRGRYKKDEMKELDAFANSLGIEIIPCIQTLAHLNQYIRWKKTPVDCNDILLTDDEKTYELIEKMFLSLSECFASRKIHLGMDEAQMLGRGKHLDIHGYEPSNDIIKRHLARVSDMAKAHGYECMLWSDMFFRSWNNDAYYIPKSEVPKEIKEAIPEAVIPVYWDYYSPTKERYDDMLYNHKQLSNKTWFAGGIWSWLGIVPLNRFSIDSMLPAIDACRANKVENAFFTMWGDDGAECSHFSQLPSLFYIAEYAKGNTDEEKIKRKFKSFTGIDFDDFMLIDEPNHVYGYNKAPRNPSKYMLYSDYFNGFLDSGVDKQKNASEFYAELAKKLYAVAKKSRRYGYVFDTEAKLCDILAIKFELGLRTREAYKANDKETLLSLAKNEYTRLPKLIDAYLMAFEKQWMKDNKPHGFDVQISRLGALSCRTNHCRRRLLDYVNGKISRIEELEEELLPYLQKGTVTYYNNAAHSATVNIVHH